MPILEEVTTLDFEKGVKKHKTLILPCGALEQHGPHLPLGVDFQTVKAVAREVSNRTKVWVAPAIHYGLCRSTSEHPGTIGVRMDSLQATVKDVITSYYNHGIRTVIVFSGHAGGTHMAGLIDAGEQLLEELPALKIAVLSILDLGKKAFAGIQEEPRDSHAGEVETSLMMHLLPKLVRGSAPEEYPTFPPHILVRDKMRYWPDGVWGDPGKASAEKGQALFEGLVREMLELIKELDKLPEFEED